MRQLLQIDEELRVPTVRVTVGKWVVYGISIAIPVLRIAQELIKLVAVLGFKDRTKRIWAREPPLCPGVIAGDEVIQSGLVIPFFAGESLAR